MESLPPSGSREQPVSGILGRAEQAIAVAAERLLREQLHRVLDTEGSQALTTLAATVLPDIQKLVDLLPQLVQQDSADTASETAQTLGAAPQFHDQLIFGGDLAILGRNLRPVKLVQFADEGRGVAEDGEPLLAGRGGLARPGGRRRRVLRRCRGLV